MQYEMIPGIVILTVMLIGGIWQRRNEKREWNNGICAESGKPWRKFDCDSQGGRGYTDGVNYCWISYAVDIPENAPDQERKSPASNGSI
jgi:hypothetical protein